MKKHLNIWPLGFAYWCIEIKYCRTYEQTFAEENPAGIWHQKPTGKSVISHLIFQNATWFDVGVDEDQERLQTFYWLPKLHKQLYKSRVIANSSSCKTTELSELLTSCLTTVKNHVIKYCEKSMKDPVKSFLVNQKFM